MNVEDLKPLTSLRFFAAMFIVLLHAKLYVHWPWLKHTPVTLVHGVSFFFVLSGFILTHVYTSKPMATALEFLRLRAPDLEIVEGVFWIREIAKARNGNGNSGRSGQVEIRDDVDREEALKPSYFPAQSSSYRAGRRRGGGPQFGPPNGHRRVEARLIARGYVIARAATKLPMLMRLSAMIPRPTQRFMPSSPR